MIIEQIDVDGKIIVDEGTLNPKSSEHPVWLARVALALNKGDWLYAPNSGHELKRFNNVKATESKIQEFEKEVKFYLSPYGPQITDRFTSRGVSSIQALITRETISG